jgi:hypothetical protein
MSKALLNHRSFDYSINLKGNKQLLWDLIYVLLEIKLKAFREYLNKILCITKIWLSELLASILILFVSQQHRHGL